MYAFKALIALKSRAMRGSKARLRTSAAHAPPQPSGAIAADSKALHTAHPQAIFQLSQSENWHFTLYLWTCGDFHARKNG